MIDASPRIMHSAMLICIRNMAVDKTEHLTKTATIPGWKTVVPAPDKLTQMTGHQTTELAAMLHPGRKTTDD